MSFPGVPFSQSPGIQRDARIDNAEQRGARARELPARDNWVLASCPVGMTLADQTTLSADLIRFYYLGQFFKNTDLLQARLNITTAAAGQSVRSALYRYDQTTVTGRRLVKLADTEAKFDAASAGLQSVGLAPGTSAQAGTIFLGVKASNDAVGVAGVDTSAVSRAMPIYTYQDNSGPLTSIVDFVALTKSYAGKVLDVLYISPDAAQVL